MEQTDLRYLKSLAKQYPTVAAAATEIINFTGDLKPAEGEPNILSRISMANMTSFNMY